MLSENSLIDRYNKLPEWLRWILFLPISSIFSVILWFFIDFVVRTAETYEIYQFVLDVLHPVLVQILFLILVFYTIPRGELRSVKILIVLRSLILMLFIASSIFVFLGVELTFDLIFFKEFAGEILTLLASLLLFRELKRMREK